MTELGTTVTLCLENQLDMYLLSFSGKFLKIRGPLSYNKISKSDRLSRSSLANSMPLKPAPTIPTRAPLGNSLILWYVSRDLDNV